jgi:hypothetical protein
MQCLLKALEAGWKHIKYDNRNKTRGKSGMKQTDRRTFMETLGATAAMSLLPRAQGEAIDRHKAEAYTVAAYYFGNYHVDPRNEAAHGPGWTEWRLIQDAKPRFRGHAQPKVPLWGYEDESDPAVFERKIAAASKGGLSAFIFDWYWYNDGPFLEAALEKGYLGAKNRDDLKFAIMWANHDWLDIQPAKLSSPPHLQYAGTVTLGTFRRLTDHIITKYFSIPSYWAIDGCPYFSIYELYKFVLSMGGVGQAANALKEFRAKTKAAGFKDVHINAVTWGIQLLPGETAVTNLKDLLQQLEIDSTTSYVWIHHATLEDFPVTQYEKLGSIYESYRATASATLGKPYFPNVSMGWDSSPRACQSDIFIKKAYPFLPVVEGNTPEAFGKALTSAKNFLDQSADLKHKILTINSWNEWTEGSYLEPDSRNKYGYLEAMARVFPK